MSLLLLFVLTLSKSYNKYAQITARAVRNAFKEEQRVLAEKRGVTNVKYQKWENGTGGPQVCVSLPLKRVLTDLDISGHPGRGQVFVNHISRLDSSFRDVDQPFQFYSILSLRKCSDIHGRQHPSLCQISNCQPMNVPPTSWNPPERRLSETRHYAPEGLLRGMCYLGL